MSRQKSTLIEAWKNRRTIESIGDMVAKMLHFDVHKQVSKDEAVKRSTASFHISNEPKL